MATSMDGQTWNMINNTSFVNEILTNMYSNPKTNTTFFTSYRPALPPTNLSATGKTDTTISISFTAPTTVVTSYTVTAVPTSGTTVTQTFNAPATTYTITGLTVGVQYTISMTSTNALATSNSSSSIIETTVDPHTLNRMSNTSLVVAAYGFKRQSSNTGPTVNIRNGTTNVTSDFYANITGALGTAINATGTSLTTWLGAATGFVTTWYDQSGRNKHLTQATTTSQPSIGSNANGYYAYFNNKTLSTGNVFDTTTVTNAHIVSAIQEVTRVPNVLITLNGNVGDRFWVLAPWGGTGAWTIDFKNDNTDRASSVDSIVSLGSRAVFSGYKSSADNKNGFRVNTGTRFLSPSSSTVSVSNGLQIGSTNSWNSNHYVYGLIVCNAKLGTADETLLESNI
jgi:hypothetical protein